MLTRSFRALALLAFVFAATLLAVDGRRHRKHGKGDVDDSFDVDGLARRSLEARVPSARRRRKHGKGDADDSFDVDGPAKGSLATRAPKTGPKKSLKQKLDAGKKAGLKILLTSDSHGKAGADWTYATAHPLPDADVLIHCGDMTDLGRQGEYQTVIDYFAKHPAKKKLFIGGNHDLTLDLIYMLKNAVGDGKDPIPSDLRGRKSQVIKSALKAHMAFEKDAARKAGVELLAEGMHTISVTNSEDKKLSFKIFVSPYTPALRNFAYGYDPDKEKRFNTPGRKHYIPNLAAMSPHFVITHGPPKGVLDKTTSGVNGGDQNLFDAIKRVKPIFHAFGHIHEAAGVEKWVWADEKGDTSDKLKNTCLALFDLVSGHSEADSRLKDRINDDVIDLTDPKHDYERGNATIFLNVSEKDKDFKNSNPWKLVLLEWGSDNKKAAFKNYKKVKKADRKAKTKAKVRKLMGNKDN